MSFSEILQGISNVGRGVVNALGGAGEAAAKMKNPATGVMEPQQGFWGQMVAGIEKSPLAQLIQRNVKFGGVPISQPGNLAGPNPAVPGLVGKYRAKGGPALQKGGGLELGEKDKDLIKKIGEDYAKSKADKAAYKQYLEGQKNKAPTWSAAVEEAYKQSAYEAPPMGAYPESTDLYGSSQSTYEPEPIDWEEYYKFFYSQHPELE